MKSAKKEPIKKKRKTKHLTAPKDAKTKSIITTEAVKKTGRETSKKRSSTQGKNVSDKKGDTINSKPKVTISGVDAKKPTRKVKIESESSKKTNAKRKTEGSKTTATKPATAKSVKKTATKKTNKDKSDTVISKTNESAATKKQKTGKKAALSNKAVASRSKTGPKNTGQKSRNTTFTKQDTTGLTKKTTSKPSSMRLPASIKSAKLKIFLNYSEQFLNHMLASIKSAKLKIFLPGQTVTEEIPDIYQGSLPDEYAENSVIALAVDPTTIFVDWEMIPKDIADIEGELNLRFYDVTGTESNVYAATSFIDIRIDARVGKGFFDINMPGRDVIVAAGIIDIANGFIPIVVSDIVSFPAMLEFDDLGIVQKLLDLGIPVGY